MRFFTKVKRQGSAPVIELDDIKRIRTYQESLIDEMLYNNPYSKSSEGYLTNQWSSMLLDEIRSVDRWLKKATQELVNNNLRTLGEI